MFFFQGILLILLYLFFFVKLAFFIMNLSIISKILILFKLVKLTCYTCLNLLSLLKRISWIINQQTCLGFLLNLLNFQLFSLWKIIRGIYYLNNFIFSEIIYYCFLMLIKLLNSSNLLNQIKFFCSTIQWIWIRKSSWRNCILHLFKHNFIIVLFLIDWLVYLLLIQEVWRSVPFIQ
jgi:hypothetical protein